MLKEQILILKRWKNMLSGKSVFHMRQTKGRYYEKGKLKGYYSDLRHKVTSTILLNEEGVPYNLTNTGKEILFPITIFQYGLGAYDLYLETRDKSYLKKFDCVIEWAVKSQNAQGAWNSFWWMNQKLFYSSMAQGEGISLLCRAYLVYGESIYLERAKKALDFMLLSKRDGGTTVYHNNKIITFEENLERNTILNGMIFSIWGLYDFTLVSNEEKYKRLLSCAVKSLVSILPMFDCKIWSYYDLGKNMAGPFYHDLHIEQLKTLYDLFGNFEFIHQAEIWERYKKSFVKSKVAFIIKVFQKLRRISAEPALIK